MFAVYGISKRVYHALASMTEGKGDVLSFRPAV
jgi:hypothetical protein